MRLALREMRRRPSRFVTATAILTLIALLLMFLGGLLDGLVTSATGAIEGQNADLIVTSSSSQASFPSSRITPEQRAAVAAVPGVADVGGLGVAQLGARLPDRGPRDLVDVALFGYEIPPKGVGEPPPAGEAYADATLENEGITQDMTILIGPARTPVKVIGFVPALSYSGQGTLWASSQTWRDVQNANRPDARVGDGVFQALVVVNDGSVPDDELASRIDAATAGATTTLSTDAAAKAQPGVEQQSSTFNQIIGVTVMIAIVVVALFFALLVVERTALYGVFKAIGARSGTLFGIVVVQAVVVTLIASVVGAALSITLDLALPAGAIPFTITAARILISVAFLLAAAVIGCAFSLRRVLHIDPASAIGTAS